MKTKYLIFILVISFLGSCKNETKYHDVIYFTGTEESATVKFAIDDEMQEMGLSVTSSTKVSDDVIVNLKYSPEKIDEYNKINGKKYKLVPDGSFKLSAEELIIETGKNTSKQIKLSISTEKLEEGVTYMLPFSITNASDFSVLEASRTIYVVINRTIITKAAKLGNNYFKVDFSKQELKSVPAVTYETRIFVNKFQSISPFISSVMGIEEHFLLRFGDVGVDPDKLQLAGGGYPLASPNSLSTNNWHHVAIVYDGAKLNMYLNGKEVGTREAPRGPIDLTNSYSGGFHIGYSANGRYLDGYVSECRVWTKALSQSEIQNNMCYVDPTSEGLLAYWRFNDANGKTVLDYTGNGYNAKAIFDIEWMEKVKCP